MADVLPAPTAIEFDEDGLLRDPRQWNEGVARQIARSLDLPELTAEHWQVIRALRDHYAEYGVAPAMSQICRQYNQSRGWVHDLFQTCLNAWRVAGLPNPGEEAKSYLSGM